MEEATAEIRVRPVTRYVVTVYAKESGVETIGEFLNLSTATKVGLALTQQIDGAAFYGAGAPGSGSTYPEMVVSYSNCMATVDGHTPTPEQAINSLAAYLYWDMGRLDPEPETPDSWEELSEKDKRFYRFLVEDLVRFGDLIKVAQDGAHQPPSVYAGGPARFILSHANYPPIARRATVFVSDDEDRVTELLTSEEMGTLGEVLEAAISVLGSNDDDIAKLAAKLRPFYSSGPGAGTG